MTKLTRFALLALALALVAPPLIAEDPEEGETSDEKEATKESAYKEVMVVTASRVEQPLHEVPAAVTVISSEQMEQTPADDVGDYLRNVPGLNVSQMSARDIQVTGRAATNSLATTQLVLLDNRSLYLDFFGFVMWDFAPMDPREIKQIEVVRGPGSAVWGANAMTGVINMITKSPKEMVGTSVVLGGGELGTGYANLTHAGVSGKLGYKVSAAYYEQDPYPRPTGVIEGTNTPYPPFENEGTRQPKINLRLDYDQDEETTWSFATGYAETDGIIHSGIGPFDIDSGTSLGYAKVDWSRRAARVTFFANVLDGLAPNLLTVGPDLQPISFVFESETYNLDFSNTNLLGENHILTYGLNARRNEFDLSIAPLGETREEFGLFVQDEVRFSDRVRWLLGARIDDIDPIDTVVSPRTSLLISPTPDHTFRLSYNRAFRAPSMVNNFLDTDIFNAIDDIPTPVGPVSVAFGSAAVGNLDLQEERVDAAEVGYVGTFGKTTFTVSLYRNETSDSLDFFESAAYPADRAQAPPGTPILTSEVVLPLPPPQPPIVCAAGTLLANCPIPGLYEGIAPNLPLEFSYRNIGETVDRGVELSVSVQPNPAWSFYVNYSYQDEPDVTGIPQETLPDGTVRDAINTPPEHRVNVGFGYSGERFFASGTVNYTDEGFWTDVLDSRFWGPTDDYTMVNLSLGVDISENVRFSVIGQNVFDEEVLQHVFGDVISRKITGQLLFRF